MSKVLPDVVAVVVCGDEEDGRSTRDGQSVRVDLLGSERANRLEIEIGNLASTLNGHVRHHNGDAMAERMMRPLTGVS